MLQASCHCGAVKIDMRRRPRSVTQCTCSICHRYGAQWAYFHCKRCGCLTHYESTRKLDTSRIAVNARMLDPSDIADVRVRTFDGAKTWKYLDG